MRVNKFIASHTNISRRKVDELINDGRITVNDQLAYKGQKISSIDKIKIEGKLLTLIATTAILLNKPKGYVCSRNGQGSKTVYDLLPKEYRQLKSVGRLDKDSSGLLLLTNDGNLAYKLTHPSFKKEKKYLVTVSPELTKTNKQNIEAGIMLEDGISKLNITTKNKEWLITMHEGRNRQIRRTFEAIGYTVTKLHRIEFGNYKLGDLNTSQYKEIDIELHI